jgi:DNA-binding FrmR family transcriptional regulator
MATRGFGDDALSRRMARIQGQLHGVRNMIASDRHCLEIAGQIDAVVGALRRVRQDVLTTLLQVRGAEARASRNPGPLWDCLREILIAVAPQVAVVKPVRKRTVAIASRKSLRTSVVERRMPKRRPS